MEFNEALKIALTTRLKSPFPHKALIGMGFEYHEKFTRINGADFDNLHSFEYKRYISDNVQVIIMQNFKRESKSRKKFDYSDHTIQLWVGNYINASYADITKVNGIKPLKKLIEALCMAV